MPPPSGRRTWFSWLLWLSLDFDRVNWRWAERSGVVHLRWWRMHCLHSNVLWHPRLSSPVPGCGSTWRAPANQQLLLGHVKCCLRPHVNKMLSFPAFSSWIQSTLKDGRADSHTLNISVELLRWTLVCHGNRTLSNVHLSPQRKVSDVAGSEEACSCHGYRTDLNFLEGDDVPVVVWPAGAVSQWACLRL